MLQWVCLRVRWHHRVWVDNWDLWDLMTARGVCCSDDYRLWILSGVRKSGPLSLWPRSAGFLLWLVCFGFVNRYAGIFRCNENWCDVCPESRAGCDLSRVHTCRSQARTAQYRSDLQGESMIEVTGKKRKWLLSHQCRENLFFMSWMLSVPVCLEQTTFNLKFLFRKEGNQNKGNKETKLK